MKRARKYIKGRENPVLLNGRELIDFVNPGEFVTKDIGYALYMGYKATDRPLTHYIGTTAKIINPMISKFVNR